MSQYLGDISAYALAVSQGYTGTEEEYAELMASYATVGQTAVTAAQTATAKASEAATSATTATNKASEATTAATTATTKAGEASTSASTATSAKDTAVSASQTATTKATEATTAAATAVSAKDDAVSANTAAQSAKTAAQTAQTGAETAAASVSASAAQIATNAEDISQLKSEFTALESDGAVPSAGQILTDKGITDSVPYHYRKTGGDGADRLYDQIVGGTVNWNQLVPSNNKQYDYPIESQTWLLRTLGINSKANHVYAMSAEFLYTGSISVVRPYFQYILGNSFTRWPYYLDSGVAYRDVVIAKPAQDESSLVIGVSTAGQATFGSTDSVSYDKLNVFDLTAMFGSTIADYIYSLEQATAGAGVAFFKSLFLNDYYPYNAGELVSVSGLSKHKMTGFNQWDEEWETYLSSQIKSKNPIPLIAGATYYLKVPAGISATIYFKEDVDIPSSSHWSGANGTFTVPSNCHYGLLYTGTGYGTTYNHDICINLSNPAKNGTYEPYKAHSYPLDSTVELRGIPKIVDGKVCFDGDVYEYTGKVTRNTILRAYQSGDESLANAITDGTNTVVYSANASTEQAMPYQHLQQCDPNGTEEYVSTGIVPVGHNSFYPENLRAKVEGLPWNFASLIAPTESTFTATRNYTTGALFIVDNVLYKATSNIANGGTITPNTNCTATTLAEIISALA